MSYANATPKPLKFLVSNGDLVDEDGNVLAHSDSLKDMYDKACPEVKKYLLSDGSVVDEDNNLIIKNEYFKKVYDQAVPKVAKYLHSDGTIDENPSGGSGADLENNHQATIDVSTYTNPVEITPTQGKDGMKKATITLDNIPSGGGINFFNDQIPGFLLDDIVPIIVVNADGTLVSNLADVPNAKFIVSMQHGSSQTECWRKDDSSVIPHNTNVYYNDNQDFTITNGEITLSDITRTISSTTLYLNECMTSLGS